MDAKRLKKLEKMGGRVTTVKEFLGLSAAEAAIVELRTELTIALRKGRAASGMTQAALAKAIGSSQSRVAKMEGGDRQASLESLVTAVIAVGGKPKLRVVGSRPGAPQPARAFASHDAAFVKSGKGRASRRSA